MLWLANAYGQEQSNTTSAQLSQKFSELFRSYHSNGLFEGTALVADSSGIVYHQSFGIANHDYGIPNDSNTVFRMGSLEKQFTAMLTLQLIEKGKLSFQGKISDYLPKYRKSTGQRVSIEHLLTHTSGLPSYTALPNVWDDSLQLAYQPEYVLQKFCSRDLEFTPGTKYKYSNTNYFILAQILQQVSGRSLSDLLKENILDLAGMHQTGLDDSRMPLKHRATGYYNLARTYVAGPYIYTPNTIGAASIYSTAMDMYRWDRVLYTNTLLTGPGMQAYCSPHVSVSPGYSYGYGWEFTRTPLGVHDTIETMQHSGAIRAFRAIIFRVPKEKKCLILLSNSANQSGYDLFDEVMRIFRGNSFRQPKRLLADTLYTIMERASIEEAERAYKDLKKNDSARYEYGRQPLEFLAERLMAFGRNKEAIAVFALALEEDPGYFAAYYYMGKAYEGLGKVKEAIRMYEMAVAKGKQSRAATDAAFQIRYLRTLQ